MHDILVFLDSGWGTIVGLLLGIIISLLIMNPLERATSWVLDRWF